MHGCNGLRDVLPNVYIHLRRTQLCLSDNTRQNGQFNIIFCSCDMKWKSINALWDNFFLTFYAPCSKCILAYVPPVHMFSSNLLRSRFVLNESFPKSSLPDIFGSFLFVDKNINRFTSSFLSFKNSFRSLLSHCCQWKNVVDENYDENYSSTKLTLL